MTCTVLARYGGNVRVQIWLIEYIDPTLFSFCKRSAKKRAGHVKTASVKSSEIPGRVSNIEKGEGACRIYVFFAIVGRHCPIIELKLGKDTG